MFPYSSSIMTPVGCRIWIVGSKISPVRSPAIICILDLDRFPGTASDPNHELRISCIFENIWSIRTYNCERRFRPEGLQLQFPTQWWVGCPEAARGRLSYLHWWAQRRWKVDNWKHLQLDNNDCGKALNFNLNKRAAVPWRDGRQSQRNYLASKWQRNEE